MCIHTTNEEKQPLISNHYIEQQLDLHCVGVMFGKYATEKETMTLQTFHRKGTLYFVNNSHGKKDRWKIRMFIPKHSTSLGPVPKLCFASNKTISELGMDSTSKLTINDDDFIIIEFIYSNPKKTTKKSSPKPHELFLVQNKQKHFLFPLYIFSKQCFDNIYLPDFWEILVIETFFIYLLKKGDINDILLLWSAVFKCIENDSLDKVYFDLYNSKNNVNGFLSICREILKNDHVENYWKYLFESPFFLLIYVLTIPNLIENFSNNYTELFQTTFHKTIVSFIMQEACNAKLITNALNEMSNEFDFVKKFNDEKLKYFEMLNNTAMGTVSHIASISAHCENIEMVRCVLHLLQNIGPYLEKYQVVTECSTPETKTKTVSLLDKIRNLF